MEKVYCDNEGIFSACKTQYGRTIRNKKRLLITIPMNSCVKTVMDVLFHDNEKLMSHEIKIVLKNMFFNLLLQGSVSHQGALLMHVEIKIFFGVDRIKAASRNFKSVI